MIAGTSDMRTRKASTKMPEARASAIDLMIGSPAGTKAAKTENMMIAAAETTRADEAKPARMASLAEAPWT